MVSIGRNINFDLDAFFEKTKEELGINQEVRCEFKNCECPRFIPCQGLIELPITYGNGALPVMQVKNAVYHELIHVRDRDMENPEIIRMYSDTGRTIGKMGYKLFLEYVAYKEAQERFPQSYTVTNPYELGKELRETYITSERFAFSPAERFDLFYSSASLIIECYFVKGKYPDEYVFFNEAVEVFNKKYNDRIHLKWSDYERLGYDFIKSILGTSLLDNEEEVFWKNTGIEDYSQYREGL